MKTMNPCVAPRNTLSKRCHAAKKATTIITTVLCCFVAFTMSAFAAEVDITSFISTTETVLKVLLILVGAGLAIFGVINLLEGYGNDNPGAKSQGIKQTMAGIAVIMVGVLMIPVLADMMSDATSSVSGG